MPLYHKDVFFPNNLKMPKGLIPVRYSGHALKAAMTDRYGAVALPEYINVDRCVPIEVETDGDTVVKIVLRMNVDTSRDLCVVVGIPEKRGGCWIGRTVWINETNDSHNTLRVDKYARS